MPRKPIIAITMGDPGGVGPEIILKALNTSVVQDCSVPVVVGDLAVLEGAKRSLPYSTHVPLQAVPRPGDDTGRSMAVIDLANVRPEELTVGKAGAYAGRASVQYIKKAVELALEGSVDAIATAPINKETLKMAGEPWPGHTELLAELTRTDDFGMMLAGGGLPRSLGPPRAVSPSGVFGCALPLIPRHDMPRAAA